ncbi:MAG: 50S ribosomal protein L32 [Deltaproteobacteria bacterium]|nr:50S ribosomal protein L32 [Deltaproteobacteria bacterium]
MPNPKKRHSRCKRGNRRSHDALQRPAVSACPQCGEPKRPHHVCLSCGSYRGRAVIKKEEPA